MSLYLGNLSTRIHEDELERVFQRFGRCTLQLKDGYGFAVYDLRSNAEKALRSLQGRKICGESISITWSNKQPRLMQRFTRGSKSHQMQHRRKYARANFVGPGRGSNNLGDYRMNNHQKDDIVARRRPFDIHNEGRQINRVFSGKVHPKEGEDFPDEGHGVEVDAVSNDRWVEQDQRLSDDNNHMDSGLVFDRYEPDLSDERKEEEGNWQIMYEDSLNEKFVDADFSQSNNPRTQLTCFKCGIAGHRMHDCPQEDSPRQQKLLHADHRQDKGKSSRGAGGEPWVPDPKSWGKVRSSRRDNSDKASLSGKHASLRRGRYSDVAEDFYSSKEKDSGEKKRQRESDTDASEGHRGKRGRRPASPSDYDAHRLNLQSRSPKPIAVSSSSKSMNFSSLSKSKSQCSMSGSVKSKSRSRSRSRSSTSLSSSVSLGEPLSSPPNKAMVNKNDSFGNATCLVSKDVLVPVLDHRDVCKEESFKSEKPVLLEEDIIEVDPSKTEGNKSHAVTTTSCEGKTVGVQNAGEPCVCLATSAEDPNSDMLNSHIPNSLSISLEEFHDVMKHYGLKCPEESERGSSMEDFLGSARLWSWEIIYYRRHKKSPVSTENYGRRLAQNREFGITDKYIRSSSGWGESMDDRP